MSQLVIPKQNNNNNDNSNSRTSFVESDEDKQQPNFGVDYTPKSIGVDSHFYSQLVPSNLNKLPSVIDYHGNDQNQLMRNIDPKSNVGFFKNNQKNDIMIPKK